MKDEVMNGFIGDTEPEKANKNKISWRQYIDFDFWASLLYALWYQYQTLYLC